MIWVDAKTLEKPLFSERVWRLGTWEKNPQTFLAFSVDGLVIGDIAFTRIAMAGDNCTVIEATNYTNGSTFFPFKIKSNEGKTNK